MMIISMRVLNLFIFIILLILSITSATAIMIPLTTNNLTLNSDLIFIGQVEFVKSYWSDDHSKILSQAMISPQTILKGSTQFALISVEYEGGEVGDVGLQVSDEPTFASGEKVLVFLTPLKKHGFIDYQSYCVYGGAQGKYFIDKDGMARKTGFSIIGEKKLIDNDLPIDNLIKKIRSYK